MSSGVVNLTPMETFAIALMIIFGVYCGTSLLLLAGTRQHLDFPLHHQVCAVRGVALLEGDLLAVQLEGRHQRVRYEH